MTSPTGGRGGRGRALLPLAAVCALLGPAALSGCAADSGDGPVTILNSSTDETFHRWDQEAIERCADRLHLRIEQQSVPASQLITKALRMASSKSLPDVLQIDASSVPQFAEAGGLVPLADVGVGAEGVPRGIVDFGSYRGTRYAAARAVNTLALFYNKDLLRRSGVEPPTTWPELRAAAEKLTQGDRYGIALSAGGAEDGVFQFLPFLWSNGGDETHLDSARAAGALDFWKALISDDSLSRSTVNWTQADVNDRFMAREAAMMINGPWQLETLKKDKDLHWGIATIPVPTADHASVAPLGGDVYTVANTGTDAAHTERQRRAGRVIACLTSRSEQIDYALKGNYIPVDRQAAKEWRAEVPELAPLADQVAKARSRTARLGAKWPSTSLALQSAFQAALTGKSDVPAALRTAQARATGGQ